METKKAGPSAYPGIPGWVKVSGGIAIVLVALVILLKLSGHGPGRHSHPADTSGNIPHESGHMPQKGGQP